MEDIFSKNPIKSEEIKCPNPTTKIIIDSREKQSLIAANLLDKRANLEFQKLEIGDYLIGDTCIERKTITDFIRSMLNKRLQNQLIELKKYKKNILLIEGFLFDYKNYRIHENALRGMLISIAVDFKTPLIFTKDGADTATFLILEAKKQEKSRVDHSSRPTKNTKNLQEQKEFILEGFPGIGPTTSKELIKKYSSLRNIFNVSKEELLKIKSLDKTKIDNFKKILET